MFPVLCCADARHDHSPAEHVDAQTLPQAPSLQEEVGWELAAEVGNVENRRQPRVLLADEVGVFSQAEDRLGSEGGFVGLLDAVAEPHEREKVAVDFAEDVFVLFGREVCFGEDFDGAFLFFGGGEFLVGGEGGLFLIV